MPLSRARSSVISREHIKYGREMGKFYAFITEAFLYFAGHMPQRIWRHVARKVEKTTRVWWLLLPAVCGQRRLSTQLLNLDNALSAYELKNIFLPMESKFLDLYTKNTKKCQIKCTAKPPEMQFVLF